MFNIVDNISLPGHLIVDPSGYLLDRLVIFNHVLSTARRKILTSRGTTGWTDSINTTLDVLLEGTDEYLNLTSKRSHIKGIVLKWHEKETKGNDIEGPGLSNVLLTDYYQWITHKSVCAWIGRPKALGRHFYINYKDNCFSKPSMGIAPQMIRPIDFNLQPVRLRKCIRDKATSYPPSKYKYYPEHVLHLHILQDAVVEVFNGQVVSQLTRVVPHTCTCFGTTEPQAEYNTTPIYNEVFVVTQYWGESFYHRMVELFPRLSPFLQFLKENVNIKIHINGGAEDDVTKMIFTSLGLNPSRAVQGTLRSKVAYLPRGTPCGIPNIPETQILANVYHNYIKKEVSPTLRNKLILIKRSANASRAFQAQAEIEDMVKTIAGKYNLQYYLWDDDPLPPISEAMRVFYQAAMIVAPHGAGEANMVFSQPGTYVIEVICNRPYMNLCYQRLAHILGLRYFAVQATGGCDEVILVNPATIQYVMEWYLRRGLELS